MTKGRPPYTNIRRSELCRRMIRKRAKREYCLAKNARHRPTHHAKGGRDGDPVRAARLGPSLAQKRRSFRMTRDREFWWCD